jgi:hypothetical protein
MKKFEQVYPACDVIKNSVKVAQLPFLKKWKIYDLDNTKMADCTLFLVKIFRKPSKVRKSCKGSSYITLKVLSNKTKLIFIAISL